MKKNSTTKALPLETGTNIFAGYKVIVKGREKLSLEDTHQIQRVALLLNAYESFKPNKKERFG